MAYRTIGFGQPTIWNNLDSGTAENHYQDGDASPIPAAEDQMMHRYMKAN